MINDQFYDILDSEIELLNEKFKDNTFLSGHNAIEGKKSFGFLLWFLSKYLPNSEISSWSNMITEGNDDSSADIIFENKSQSGEDIFYVIQAKWHTKSNIQKHKGITNEIKACMTDFRLILSGNKKASTNNENFNIQYEKLKTHKNNNKKIKFIFLALCSGEVDISEYVDDFADNRLVFFDYFDFSRIKKQYIEINYKGIKTHNPLEEPYLPSDVINIPIKKEQVVNISSPFRSNIFIIQPKIIFELFDRFGNSIFYKNIRNPIPKSLYNIEIKNTVLRDPKYFWYFNNGITAITEKIFDFHKDAETISIRSIQVINGAQTFYSIYSAYRDASESERQIMNDGALITLRVVETGGEDFDLKVTRYTNSQNPISERDFHANDAVQKKLQSDFFENTYIWYETRRGEFPKKHPSAVKVSNLTLGQLYLAYFLNDPFSAKQSKKLIFCSAKTKANGLYESIFNPDTKYQDMLIPYYLEKFIERKRKEMKNSISKIDTKHGLSADEEKLLKFDFIQYSSFEIIALFKLFLLKINEINPEAMNGKLSSVFKNNDYEIIEKCYKYIINFIFDDLEKKKTENLKIVNSVLFKSKDYYPKLRRDFLAFVDNEDLSSYKM